jgi:hypothetical protein
MIQAETAGAYVEDDGVEERGEVEGEQGVGPVLVLAEEERLCAWKWTVDVGGWVVGLWG